VSLATAAAAATAMSSPAGSRSPQYQTRPVTGPRPATSTRSEATCEGNANPKLRDLEELNQCVEQGIRIGDYVAVLATCSIADPEEDGASAIGWHYWTSASVSGANRSGYTKTGLRRCTPRSVHGSEINTDVTSG
jgi:hypothetical protein